MNIPLIDRAAQLAHKHHKDQIRKGDGTPYFNHLSGVAVILAHFGCDEETIAAGYGHDLLEDTSCTEQEILDQCGENVLNYIKTVTHDPSLNEKDDWEEIRVRYIKAVKEGPDQAKAVCLADKIHNRTMLYEAVKNEGDTVHSRFNRSKDIKDKFEKTLLNELKEVWSHPLLVEYEELLNKTT